MPHVGHGGSDSPEFHQKILLKRRCPHARAEQDPFKINCLLWKKMVGVARIELATPAMSTQCSTTELHAHPGVSGGI